MLTYISLVKFTRDGITTLKDQGIARSENVKATIESLGGKLIAAYYCLGEYDVVAIHEFPDNKSAMKASVLTSSLGAYRVTTMPAVSRDEWRQILQEIWPSKGRK